eukprot:TRINITY_DN44096_c0_g1_i1.p1 TRINITY_DN44096_c0_g1~~TRINITY_DN44096_c0_g1_i1.p1  ORF type:complete len:620 (-),score=76.17 TRINITY_DN44096_c0_g1_i1:213-2072(-)
MTSRVWTELDSPPWPDFVEFSFSHFVLVIAVTIQLFLNVHVRFLVEKCRNCFSKRINDPAIPPQRFRLGLESICFEWMGFSLMLYLANMAFRAGSSATVGNLGSSTFHHDLFPFMIFVYLAIYLVRSEPEALIRCTNFASLHWFGMGLLIVKSIMVITQGSSLYAFTTANGDIFREVDWQFMQSMRMFLGLMTCGHTGVLHSSVSNFILSVVSIISLKARGLLTLESIISEASAFCAMLGLVSAFHRQVVARAKECSEASRQMAALRELIMAPCSVFVILYSDLTICSAQPMLASLFDHCDFLNTSFETILLPEDLDGFRQFIQAGIVREAATEPNLRGDTNEQLASGKKEEFFSLVSGTGTIIPVKISHVTLPPASGKLGNSETRQHLIAITKCDPNTPSTSCNQNASTEDVSIVSDELRSSIPASFESFEHENGECPSGESVQSFVGALSDAALSFDGLDPDMLIVSCSKSFKAISGCVSVRGTSLLSWLTPTSRESVASTVRKKVVTKMSSINEETTAVYMGLWSLIPPRPKRSGSGVMFRSMCTLLLPKSSEGQEDGTYIVTVLLKDIKQFRERAQLVGSSHERRMLTGQPYASGGRIGPACSSRKDTTILSSTL